MCVCMLSLKKINLKIPTEEWEQEKKRGKMVGKGKGTRHALDGFTVNQNGSKNGTNIYDYLHHTMCNV